MYFDDLPVGFTFRTETAEVTQEAIITFARQYDPQVFHLDPEAAKDTAYGGLIASGIHTMGIALRLVLDADIWTEASMGSPGFDELRWLIPVRPGDRLHVRGEVIGSVPSASRPDRGRTRIRYETVNQAGEVVMRYEATQILKRKP